MVGKSPPCLKVIKKTKLLYHYKFIFFKIDCLCRPDVRIYSFCPSLSKTTTALRLDHLLIHDTQLTSKLISVTSLI